MVLPHLQNNHKTGSGRCGPNFITTTLIFLLAVILIVINYDDEAEMISNNSAATHLSNGLYGMDEREEIIVDMPSVIHSVDGEEHLDENLDQIQIQRESSE